MQSLVEKLLLLILLGVIGILGYIFFINKNTEGNISVLDSKNASIIKDQRAKKVEKGVDWISKNKDTLDPESSVSIIYLYKATNDAALADRLSVLIKEMSAKIKIIDTNFNTKDKKYLNWSDLKEVFFSLERKQCKNADYKNDLSKFNNYFTDNKDKIFPKSSNLGQKLVAYYTLNNLISVNDDYDKTILEIRGEMPNTSSKNYALSLYDWTHIIFTQSGYFDHYLNPGDYQKEIKVFNEAISYFNKSSLDDLSLDVSSEVLVSMKLLNQTQGKEYEELLQKIILYQNPDGSFGKETNKIDEKFHHTAVALLAISDFTKQFRNAKNACFY